MVDGAALEKRCAKAPRVRIPPSPPTRPKRWRPIRALSPSVLAHVRTVGPVARGASPRTSGVVRSLRSSAPPSPRTPSRRADVSGSAFASTPGSAGGRSSPWLIRSDRCTGRGFPLTSPVWERSPSGLWRRTGNAVWGNPSRVRIPPSPPHPSAGPDADACVVACGPSLTYLRVRSLRSSTPPSPRRPDPAD